MGDQSTAILYLMVSNIILWMIVICLAGMKVWELRKGRGRLRAQVLDGLGGVKDEFILGRQKELLIGKSTPANMVNIDFTGSEYAGSIEEEHAAFQRYGTFWYICAKAGNGMVGLKQKGDGTVYKLRTDIPYRIRSGDIVYISYEKILIQ